MTDWRRSFLHRDTGERSSSLRNVYLRCSEEERQLSAEFFQPYLAGHGTGLLTPFSGILQNAGPLAKGADLVRGKDAETHVPSGVEDRELEQCLGRAFAAALPNTSEEVAVAVSGGVDCWLLAALLRSRGYSVCGWYLETGIPGYCEREQVERASQSLGIACRFLQARTSDFIAAMAEFITVTQTPIYNLHPISKWLFAKALRREGITTVVTGDAADQVMRWDWDCDLLPLTIGCFQGAGVRMVAPFIMEEVIDFGRQPYPDKQPVRALAQRFRVPVAEKRPTLFPAVALPMQPRAALPLFDDVVKLASESKLSCLAYTTGLLQQWLQEPARSMDSRCSSGS